MFCEFVVRKIEMYSGNSNIFGWAAEYKHMGMDWISSFFFNKFCEPSEGLYNTD